MADVVTFDKAAIQRLRRATDKAVEQGKDVFTLDNRDYVTDYAKYLLEYLEGKLKEQENG